MVLVKTMTASTGLGATPTPKGTYQAMTGAGARWHYFTKYKVWGQYAFYTFLYTLSMISLGILWR